MIGTLNPPPREAASLNLLEMNMLGPIARWGHNVLMTAMGLLTIALVVFFIK
jgi:hypothetical protein